MSTIDDLGTLVRVIATELQSNIRTNSAKPNQAGWGQFLGAAHAHQVGPYGTCAGLLAISIGQAGATTDVRTVKQVEDFWSSGVGSKLYEQNVRLAFLVLSLAKIRHADLKRTCDAVAHELRGRQLQDGSWGDWRDNDGNPAPGRSEATAWAVLALGRLNPTDATAIRGAEYLAGQVTGTGQFQILSPIAVAAALSVLPRERQTAALRRQARSLVQSIRVDQAEHISFFDYVQPTSESRLARDYLCFPAFYPLSLLINGLLRHSRGLELLKLAVARTRAIERLTSMIGTGGPYRLPGARFAATVDQAFVALTYEQLAENPPSIDPWLVPIRPIWHWASNSILIRVVVPFAIIACAMVTLESPTAVPEAVQHLSGAPLGSLIKLMEENESIIRLVVAGLLVVFPQLPSSVWTFIKQKLGL